MNREQFYAAMSGEGTLDYELYLNTKTLLSCQSKFEDLCNGDELQFQLVHQIEELWMKLIAYTLLDIDEFLQRENTNRVVTLFRRVHMAQRLMIQQVALLETMSPKEYQEIRKRLGNGSGQESPGFRALLRLYQPIWNSFKENYLDKHGLNVKKIYDSEYSHDDAYVVAEALAEFDELFQKFRYEHMQLIHRTIGFGSNSLKGRPVEILEEGMRHKFYPELWEIRSHMTDAWGAVYGMKRDSLGGLH
ncbi:MAG: tryptophan 2,3-dioxygenase [Acidobacteria bacterium]|nr:MAG: tryptophan 2,3-dioxygenase [Acidobacteriota bacterium]PYU50833.1 MAG: tryptophan 2,3-dioxygenase [Acidobacteriota bacterium]PYU56328.1 MAG: tryptophan 2,3-dioxygenase [Acidobacteriota bacterium]PYU70737.1 MAG: tryptophan 2,3-dioxygenase [Acidobacteriota bacterium]